MNNMTCTLAVLTVLISTGCDENGFAPPVNEPAQIEIVSGSGQVATVGMILPAPLVVRVLDEEGAAVAAQPVTWSVVQGEGSVEQAAVLTNAEGRAEVRWQLGPIVGAVHRVEARAIDGNTGQVYATGSFTATAVAEPQAPVATVTVAPQPAGAPVGGTVQLTATLRDAQGTVLTGRAVTWTTANDAVATVNANGLVTGVAVGSTTITAGSEGQQGSTTVNVTAAPPPPPAGEWGTDVRFSSRWDVVGSSLDAIKDGGKWPNHSSNPDLVLSVMADPTGSAPTPNVLRATYAASTAGQIETSSATVLLTAGQSYYYRIYRYVSGLTANTNHADNLGPHYGSIGQILWSAWNGNGSTYDPKFGALKTRAGFSPAEKRFLIGPLTMGSTSIKLQQGQWYRFEYFIDFYDPANPSRFRIYPRVYDDAGVLIAGSEDWQEADPPNQMLLDWYNVTGAYLQTASLENTLQISLGFEDTIGGANPGVWYYAAAKVCADNWCGPE